LSLLELADGLSELSLLSGEHPVLVERLLSEALRSRTGEPRALLEAGVLESDVRPDAYAAPLESA
jgi:hypothetical protein